MINGKGILRGICAVLLAVVLTACGGIGSGPSKQLVQQAIAQQLSQAQKELGQQLRLASEPTETTVKRVSIDQQLPLMIQGLQSYRVRGTYDYTVKLPKRQVSLLQNSFDLYLQRQKEGKTWRLAKQLVGEAGETTWVTQRLKQF